MTVGTDRFPDPSAGLNPAGECATGRPVLVGTTPERSGRSRAITRDTLDTNRLMQVLSIGTRSLQ